MHVEEERQPEDRIPFSAVGIGHRFTCDYSRSNYTVYIKETESRYFIEGSPSMSYKIINPKTAVWDLGPAEAALAACTEVTWKEPAYDRLPPVKVVVSYQD